MATVITMPYPELITIDGDVEYEQNLLTARFGDGYSQIAPNGLNSIYEIHNITWGPIEYQIINDTIINQLKLVGGHGYILWTPRNETIQKQFKVKEGKFKKSFLGGCSTKISTILIQSFDIIS